jgi:hypothetical protein
MFRELGEEDISCQHIYPDAQNTGNTDKSFLIPKRIGDYEEYFIDLPLDENSPNYSGSIEEFSKVCSKILSFDPHSTKITAYEKGIRIFAYDSSGKKVKENGFGIFKTEENENVIQSISMELALVKAFSKIKNISPPKGIIKFYCVPDMETIKIVVSVGCYGKLTIFLRNPQEDEEDGNDE